MLARSTALQGTVLVLAVVLVYANSVGNSWHYDDRHAIVENPHIRSLSQVPSLLTDASLFSRDANKAMFRPLLLTSFALNYAWSQGEVYSYRLVNIAVHAGVALAVWQVLAALGMGWAASLGGGLLMALHPVATEPVNYISARSESLAALFALACAALHLRAAGSRAARALSVLCFGLGLLCKESTAVVPLLLVAADWARRRPWRACRAAYTPYAAALALYMVAEGSFLHRAVAGEPVRSMAVQLGTQTKATVHYLTLLAMPTNLNVHHPFEAAAWGAAVAAAGLLLISLAWLARAAARSHRGLSLAMLWVALPLAPTALVPLNVLVNDHRPYLSLVGVALAAVLLARGQRPAVCRAGAACLVCLAALTATRNTEWLSPHTLWTACVREAPHPVDAVAHVHLGNAAKARGAFAEAVEYYEAALEIVPGHVLARHNLGTAYQGLGNHDRAMAIFAALLEDEPELGEARYNLARSQQAQGQYLRAIGNYLRVPDSNYNYHAALNNAGTAYEQAGAVDSAAHWYGEALALRPEAPDPRRNLSRLLRGLPDRAQVLIESGRAAQLAGLCRVLARVAPADPNPGYYLSVAHLLQGDVARAVDTAAALVRVHPRFEAGYLHLANALESAGRYAEAVEAYDRQAATLPYGELADEARKRRAALVARLAGSEEAAGAAGGP